MDRLILQVIQETRSVPLSCTEEALERRLYDTKQLLQLLRAFGWGEITFKLKNSKLEAIPVGESHENSYYQEAFEEKYTKILKDCVSTLSHDSPLSPLT